TTVAYSCTGTNGWNTTAANYLRLYTPFASSEVGASQRHSGVWGAGYQYVVTVPALVSDAFDLYGINFVKIDGLQISYTPQHDQIWGVTLLSQTPGALIDVSNNIIKAINASYNDVSLIDIGLYLDPTSTHATARIWNNILYVTGSV